MARPQQSVWCNLNLPGHCVHWIQEYNQALLTLGILVGGGVLGTRAVRGKPRCSRDGSTARLVAWVGRTIPRLMSLDTPVVSG